MCHVYLDVKGAFAVQGNSVKMYPYLTVDAIGRLLVYKHHDKKSVEVLRGSKVSHTRDERAVNCVGDSL
jgi:hypothetical protein